MSHVYHAPRPRLLAVLVLLLSLTLTGAAGVAAQANTTEPLQIVATTTQAADLVTILAGDLLDTRLQLTALMGAGVDPHLYKPTESDIRAMNTADLVVYSGLHLEGQFDQVFEALGQQNIRTYALAKPVQDQGFTIGGFDLSDELQNVDDPHFWFDPRNWQLAAEGLTEVLSATDPDNAATYQANYDAYFAALDALYAWGVEAMALIPEGQRSLVTSHDAFQYFGIAFGWQVKSVQGISTVSEAGVADVQDVADYVVANGIPVMFVESSVPPNTIDAVRAAVSAAGQDVTIGVRELYSDAMDEPGTFGGTYIGMLATNIITILQSFGYEVPPFPDGLEPAIPADLLVLAGTD